MIDEPNLDVPIYIVLPLSPPGPSVADVRVEIAGVNIASKVASLRLEAGVDQITTLTLELRDAVVVDCVGRLVPVRVVERVYGEPTVERTTAIDERTAEQFRRAEWAPDDDADPA